MTIRELKEFLTTVSPEFDKYDVVISEFDYNPENLAEFRRLDKPITFIAVDEETKEMIFVDDVHTQNLFKYEELMATEINGNPATEN